jgi:hypothetical protein
MTVEELLIDLQGYNSDITVKTYDDDSDLTDINFVSYDEARNIVTLH